MKRRTSARDEKSGGGTRQGLSRSAKPTDGTSETGESKPNDNKSGDLVHFPDWKDELYTWLRVRIGAKGAITVVLLSFVVPFAWSNWETIREMNGIRTGVDWLNQPSLPHASPSGYSIIVARLDGDSHREAEGRLFSPT
jgi:hypothetical protein